MGQGAYANPNLLKEAHELTNDSLLSHVSMAYFLEFSPFCCSSLLAPCFDQYMTVRWLTAILAEPFLGHDLMTIGALES